MRACWQAYKNLQIDEIPHDGRDRSEVPSEQEPARAAVTEMHTTLFAVGDCFGVAGAEGRARAARERLRDVLAALAQVEMPRARILRRPARAAAYLLTVTAQPSDSGKDFSQELLEKLAEHPDPVTERLSNWALKFRFAAAGSVRPLLAAAQLPLDDYSYPLQAGHHGTLPAAYD